MSPPAAPRKGKRPPSSPNGTPPRSIIPMGGMFFNSPIGTPTTPVRSPNKTPNNKPKRRIFATPSPSQKHPNREAAYRKIVGKSPRKIRRGGTTSVMFSNSPLITKVGRSNLITPNRSKHIANLNRELMLAKAAGKAGYGPKVTSPLSGIYNVGNTPFLVLTMNKMTPVGRNIPFNRLNRNKLTNLYNRLNRANINYKGNFASQQIVEGPNGRYYMIDYGRVYAQRRLKM